MRELGNGDLLSGVRDSPADGGGDEGHDVNEETENELLE